MSYANLLHTVKRSWAWLAIALVLGALGGGAGFAVTSPTYESSAQILLLPSVESLRGSAPPNPFLALSQSLQETAAIIATRVTSVATVKDIRATGAVAPYTVTPDDSLNAPVVKIVATDANRDVAQTTMLAVVKRFSTELTAMQADAGAPERSMIGTTVIAQSPEPRTVVKTVIRNAIALGVLGLLVGLIPLLLRERRRVRRQALAEDLGVGRETVSRPVPSVSVTAEAEAEAEAEAPLSPSPSPSPSPSLSPSPTASVVMGDAARRRSRARLMDERAAPAAGGGAAASRRARRPGT